jgi:hypothetical protein
MRLPPLGLDQEVFQRGLALQGVHVQLRRCELLEQASEHLVHDVAYRFADHLHCAMETGAVQPMDVPLSAASHGEPTAEGLVPRAHGPICHSCVPAAPQL